MRSFIASIVSLALLLFFASVADADTSLWIPDTDPQPISVGIEGVGPGNRTTWAIQQGSATGTFTDPADFGLFPGTATLIEGPSDAVESVAITTSGVVLAAHFSCPISNGMAVCVGVVSEGGTVSTFTDTETVSPLLVQGGGPVSGSGSGSVSSTGSGPAASGPTTAVGTSPTQSASGKASAGATPTSAGAQATGTGSTKNAAGRHQVVGSLLCLGVIVGSMMDYVI